MIEGVHEHVVEVDGFRMRYLEAGDPSLPHLVLLHSCDPGVTAEFSWEENIPSLAAHFHIIAPDSPGYGGSDKFFDFTGGHMPYRIRFLRRLLQTLCIEEADFAGNSCGASMPLFVASRHPDTYRSILPVRRLVLVSPSIIASGPGPARPLADGYDGSLEAMRLLVRATFVDDRWGANDAYVRRRHESSLTPGHLETLAAARLRPPTAPPSPPDRPDWSKCAAPVLLITGDSDPMVADADGGAANCRGIPDASIHVLPGTGHCAQIERADVFNDLALAFLA